MFEDVDEIPPSKKPGVDTYTKSGHERLLFIRCSVPGRMFRSGFHAVVLMLCCSVCGIRATDMKCVAGALYTIQYKGHGDVLRETDVICSSFMRDLPVNPVYP